MRTRWYAMGKAGEIIDWRLKDPRIKTAPLVELEIADLQMPLFKKHFGTVGHDPKVLSLQVKKTVRSLYQRWGKFGPYGDLLQISFDPSRGYFHIEFIGRLAFPKPSLATDLVLFFQDRRGKKFFVGITRKKDPGKGQPALPGGHLDVNGYHLETAAEALIHEALDEIGLKIKTSKTMAKDLVSQPDLEEIKVQIQLSPDLLVTSQLRLLGKFPTSKEEELPHLGQKRVHLTTAYLLVVPVAQSLTKKQIRTWLTAGDDADQLFICQLGHNQWPRFAIEHHQTIFEMAADVLIEEINLSKC